MSGLIDNPESFEKTEMLWVDVEINKVLIRALVDTGAQMSIMIESASKKCNLGYLVDTRMSGMALGVGSRKIVGKVHKTDIRFGSNIYSSSFTILEDSNGPEMTEFIIGLDILKKLQCCVDLKHNKLIFGDGNEVTFVHNDVQPPPPS